jgi:carbon-monoxide dehydrogenase small subunit
VPALIAAGAVATLAGPRGWRELPVEDVMLGPRKLALTKGEFVVSFLLPPRPPRSSDAYLRFIPRTEMDIAVVGAGVSLTVDAAGTISAARVSLGAVAPRVLLVAEAAAAIVGSHLDRAAQDRLVRADRRQTGNGGIPRPGRRRAGTPGRLDRAGPSEERLMAKHHIEMTVNGDGVEFLCETEETLLDVLRDTLHLTGSKEGCASGDCGACSIMLDGRLVCACLVLGCEVGGRRVETIEGLAKGEALHPLQQKFLEHAALQCGICTPGFIVAGKALLEKNPNPTDTEIRYWLAGNLCRCTGYDKIVTAVKDAAVALRKG